MDFYLVQHGEAKREQEDPSRPLTTRGAKEVERVAVYLEKAGVKVSEIRCSRKLRACQTAEILQEHLTAPSGVRQIEGLAPMDDPSEAAAELKSAAEPNMLVGHLPYLSRLASLLLVGNASKEVVRFRMGGVVCLAREEEKWKVKWILTPDMLP